VSGAPIETVSAEVDGAGEVCVVLRRGEQFAAGMGKDAAQAHEIAMRAFEWHDTAPDWLRPFPISKRVQVEGKVGQVVKIDEPRREVTIRLCHAGE
jgi:hypothetical protein